MRDLIVREPFSGHHIGARITDKAKVRAILDGPNAHHVIAVAPLPRTEPAAIGAPVVQVALKRVWKDSE
jgi:hypothetical protein